MEGNFNCVLSNRITFHGARWLRLAIILWIVLAAAVCVKSVVQKGEHSVYRIYAAGSRHWWADLPLHAKYPELPDIYRYSPTFAVMFTPFSLLPDWLGSCLWSVLSVAATFSALRVFVREILPGDWTAGREGVFLGLTAFGSMSGIWSGQINSLILAIVIFAAAAIKRRRWWTASFLLMLPVFIKLWPLAAALLLMACWPRQISWRFLIFAAAMAIAPFLTRPAGVVAGQYQQWYTSLVSEQAQERWPGYRDAWTIWENVWPPVSPRGYHALQLASSIPVLLWCLYRRRRTSSTGRLLTAIISIWVSWQLVFGPGTEQLTYGLIAPSAAWAVITSFQEQRHRLWTALTWFVLVLCSCGEIETPLAGIHPAFHMLLPLGVISFAAWLVWHEGGRD
jgi:hypothetical protein